MKLGLNSEACTDFYSGKRFHASNADFYIEKNCH
jgi:hypothetical protein